MTRAYFNEVGGEANLRLASGPKTKKPPESELEPEEDEDDSEDYPTPTHGTVADIDYFGDDDDVYAKASCALLS